LHFAFAEDTRLRYLDRMQPLAFLALRLTLGAVMIGHGWLKVHDNLHGFAGYVASMGMPAWLGYVAAFTEFIGGILVVAGLFTRYVAFAILIDMSVAIIKVHWKHGLMGNGGYEFPLAMWTIAFALIFLGAGPISLDAIRSGGGGFRTSKSR
jgi:putative oxidoreductase